MTRSTLLIAKGGSVFRTRDCTIASGEQGETEGVIRHLAQRNDIELVYFGAYRGDPLCEVIQPCMEDLDESTLAKHQKRNFEVDINALKDRKIIGFVQTAGYSPTFSMVDNPRNATVQAAAIRYTAPMHNVLNHFKIPRIVINNDPRTYPRDQEMSYGWDYSRPAALLDQCDKRWSRVVGGKHYSINSVHARAESWAYQLTRENQGLDPCVCIAHNHFTYGIKNKRPDYGDAWRDVLRGELPPNFFVYGNGWEDWDNVPWEGCVKPNEALDLFNMHVCGPVVSHTPNFYTGKPYVMMSQGCIPLLHKSYDPKCLFLREDSILRIREPGDLAKLSKKLWESESFRTDARILWETVLKPDWTLLDRLVDDLVAGKPIDQEVYGGYV